MTRQILGLKAYAYEAIRDTIPNAIVSESLDQLRRQADIILSDNVIVKSYDNGISIDLGCKKIILCCEEFSEFKMGYIR